MLGPQVYRARGGKLHEPESKMKEFKFREETVKSAKELVSQKQQESQSIGRITLDSVQESVRDVKKEQANIKTKLNAIDDNLKMLMEIMGSRHPLVDRV